MKTFFKNNSFLCLSVILAVITGFSIFMVPKIGAQGSWRLPVPCCLTAGSLMVAVDGNNIKPLDAVATGQVLISAGTGTIPAWSTTLPLSAQVHTATATLTAADCGKVHFLSHASTAIILTLPAPALGCQMKFVTALAFSDQHEVRTPASANIIEGTLQVNAADIDCTVEDSIEFADTAETLGDFAEIISDGTTWFIQNSMGAIAAALACTTA